jgi:hypothetical protein
MLVINMSLEKIRQGTKKILAGVSLLSLLGISNNSFSQYFEAYNVPPQDNEKVSSWEAGAEFGRIMNKNTTGITFGIYFNNPKFLIGYVAEINRKSKPMFPGKGIDLGKMGVEFEYFPTNMKVIRPYVGSEIKYEGESLFIGRDNIYYKQKGIGLELKCGTEFKPLKARKIRPFFEAGYNFSTGKKSKGYPQNPEVVRERFITVLGLKF